MAHNHDYYRADWGDHLTDVSWADIFKLGVSSASTEFCEWVEVASDVYLSHRK